MTSSFENESKGIDSICVSRSFTMMLFVALLLTISSVLGGDYQIISSVTPDYGYGDTTFNYTAQIQLMSENAATYSGNWQIELKIFNGSREIRSSKLPSAPRILGTKEWMTRMTQPFTFGPYNFERDFGIKRTDSASFEIVAYRDGTNVSSVRFKGPEVQPPRLLGTPNYNKQPYYVEPFQVTAVFKDKAAMNPTCYLEMHGPLNTSEKEESWTTADVAGKAQGTTYTFNLGDDVDMSKYPNGGNFSFFIIYNNALSTDREGPFSLTVRPYHPSIESIEVKDSLDYTNFTIRAYVDDVGKRLQGDSVVNSNANIFIINPKKEPKTTNMTGIEPRIIRRGGKDLLLFEWTQEAIQFSLTDVELSKSSPFKATINYQNDNWKYNATKDSRVFKVVREVPIVKVDYNRTTYVRESEPATQVITGTVSYSKGKGDLRLNLEGKDKHINESSDGVDLGGNRYKYTWTISFNNSSAGNAYPFTLTYSHPSLEGGEYLVPEKYNFTISLIDLNFKDIGVTPLNGKWDQIYTYSAKVTSSVGGVVILQMYDPCTRKWQDWGESRRIYPGETKLSWVIKPFKQECSNMQSDPPMFGFKAILDRPYESGTVEGPYIGVAMPDIRQYAVSPDSGTSEETFNYSVVLSFSKPAPIELQTYNPSLNEYVSDGTRDYSKSSQNQTLIWKVKFPVEFQGRRLSYKLIYQDNDLVVANGPTIQIGGNPRIYNSTVSPQNGSIDTEFAYRVLIGFNKKATLDLQAYNPDHQQYESMGLEDYISPGMNQTLVWKVKFPSEYAGQNVTYKILDAGTKTDLANLHGPTISGQAKPPSLAPIQEPIPGPITASDNGTNKHQDQVGVITGIGNVSPAVGVIQEWDERDSLNELTYSLQLNDSTSQEMPWVTLVVKPYGSGSNWKTVGEKKRYDPSLGNVSWTIKPFWTTPFLGMAEYKFLIDDKESEPFEGPDIVARYKAADNWTGYTHNFLVTVNASKNLTVCLQGGDSSLPENIKKWTHIGDCKNYTAGSGEQNLTWKVPDSRPLYYDFDIHMADKRGFQ